MLPEHPKFVRWALMLGIIVILNIFFTVLVSLALPTPQMADYCPAASSNAPAPIDAQSCSAAGGVWTELGVPPATATAASQPSGYCDLYATCQPIYQKAYDTHALYAFILLIGLGVLALIAGFFPIGSSIVSSGLSYGGVIALVIASAEYWGDAGQWLRLVIALIGLLILLYIGWMRFRD
ncbi:MAG: hypothetical protein ACREGR_01355 [Minisyncoccia bacterium]